MKQLDKRSNHSLMLLKYRSKLEIKNGGNNDTEGPGCHGAPDEAGSLLQKINKLQEVLQHKRDQLGKGTLPRDMWGRSSKKNQSKQRVQMLGRRMWLGEREGR